MVGVGRVRRRVLKVEGMEAEERGRVGMREREKGREKDLGLKLGVGEVVLVR